MIENLNSKNLFETGDANELFDLIIDFHNSSKEDGENGIWIELQRAFLRAFFPVLVHLRDQKKLVLTPDIVMVFAKFEKIIELSNDTDLPEMIREPLLVHLNTLYSYSKIVVWAESDENYMVAKQQHGYRSMVLYKPMDYLRN